MKCAIWRIPRPSLWTGFLPGLLIILASLTYSASADDDQDLQIFGSIAEGWRANRESFGAFFCRFTWTVGYTESLEAAFSGNLADPIAYRGMWIVDGPVVRYELICDPAVLEPAMVRVREEQSKARHLQSKETISEVLLPCSTFFYLKDRSIRARRSHGLSSVNLISVDHIDWAGIRVTPFALDSMGADEVSSPARFLQDVVEGRVIGRFNAITDFHGTPVLSVALGPEEPLRMGYLFDPERGYLPLHFWDTNPRTDKKAYEAFILDIKDCGNGRWFPVRSVVIAGDSSTPGRKRVMEMKVVELDVDRRPDRSSFYMDIPSDTQASVFNTEYYTYIHKNERVYVAKLADLYRGCVEHGEEQKRLGELMSRGARAQDRGAASRSWLFIVNGVIVAVLGLLLARRLVRRWTHP